MEPAIEARALTKRYRKGARPALDDVTFSVARGEVFGFLGPNGAGKTTTIRCLMDTIRPTSGEARVLGLDARSDRLAIHARVGFVGGELALPERRTVAEHLAFLADVRGGVPKARIDALTKRLALDVTKPLRALSRGNKQKVGLVAAFMHEPELLILDEPTSGLDPLMQQEFLKLVHEAKARGATVFLSSHILTEVEHLCDRVAIIREGKLVAVDTVAAIKSRAVRRVVATYRDGRKVEERRAGPVGEAVRRLATQDLVDLATLEPTLEDVFLSYYEKEANA